jgi:hypothetical protein
MLNLKIKKKIFLKIYFINIMMIVLKFFNVFAIFRNGIEVF